MNDEALCACIDRGNHSLRVRGRKLCLGSDRSISIADSENGTSAAEPTAAACSGVVQPSRRAICARADNCQSAGHLHRGGFAVREWHVGLWRWHTGGGFCFGRRRERDTEARLCSTRNVRRNFDSDERCGAVGIDTDDDYDSLKHSANPAPRRRPACGAAPSGASLCRPIEPTIARVNSSSSAERLSLQRRRSCSGAPSAASVVSRLTALT